MEEGHGLRFSSSHKESLDYLVIYSCGECSKSPLVLVTMGRPEGPNHDEDPCLLVETKIETLTYKNFESNLSHVSS